MSSDKDWKGILEDRLTSVEQEQIEVRKQERRALDVQRKPFFEVLEAFRGAAIEAVEFAKGAGCPAALIGIGLHGFDLEIEGRHLIVTYGDPDLDVFEVRLLLDIDRERLSFDRSARAFYRSKVGITGNGVDPTEFVAEMMQKLVSQIQKAR